MPYFLTWIDPNDLLAEDPEDYQDTELVWYLTRKELADLVDRYLRERNRNHPEGFLTFAELSESQQERMKESVARILQAQVAPENRTLAILWDQLDLD